MVAEIQGQGFVGASAPNFSLLNNAACTVGLLLQRYFNRSFSQVTTIDSQEMRDADLVTENFNTDDIFLTHGVMQDDAWGYDSEFWRLLEQQAAALPGV